MNPEEYKELTIDDWYKMNHHDWKDVVNEYNDLLTEVKRLREGILNVMAGVYDNMYYMNQALDRVIQNES